MDIFFRNSAGLVVYFRQVVILLCLLGIMHSNAATTTKVEPDIIKVNIETGPDGSEATVDSITNMNSEKSIHIAVIYPNVRAPFSNVFSEISSGIKSATTFKVSEIGIGSNTDLKALIGRLKRENVTGVIALGNRGLSLSGKISSLFTVLSGSTISNPADCPGGVICMSMRIAPSKMFTRLSQLAPKTKNIYASYKASNDVWMIDQSKRAAQKTGHNLTLYERGNVHENANYYRKLISKIGTGDALWLLQGDAALKDKNILAAILEQSWKRDFIVFSNNPGHVQKGALFALYPDNFKFGISLGNTFHKMISAEKAAFRTLTEAYTAVNLRAAEHFQLGISHSQAEELNLVFP